MPTRVTYRQAGVDIGSVDRWLSELKPLFKSTHRPGVLADRGQFAGLFRLAALKLRDPILVSSTDGVGTKLKLATRPADHTAIGIDAVAMNTNDVLAYGAEPLLFLDYVAMGKIEPAIFTALLRGIVHGCRESGCALIGGETAEMPDVYGSGEYDVAGFCVGVVERRKLIDGAQVRAGDVVIGLASVGVHANGFSLVRKVFSDADVVRYRQALLVPTRIYVKPVLAVVARCPVTAIAHVTGGGLARRLESLVAKRPDLVVRWTPDRWPKPPVFDRIQTAGRIDPHEMYRTFNMGIGMALTCRPIAAQGVLRLLRRHRVPAWVIGTVDRRCGTARRLASARGSTDNAQ